MVSHPKPPYELNEILQYSCLQLLLAVGQFKSARAAKLCKAVFAQVFVSLELLHPPLGSVVPPNFFALSGLWNGADSVGR